MAAEPAALCLDLTRLSRRVGRGPLTGVDRVERAWLRQLLTREDPVFGLVRSTLGFVLLGRPGMAALLSWSEGTPVPEMRDPLALLRRLRGGSPRSAEAALAGLALARASRLGLAAMLRRRLPAGTWYLNTGHSNLRRRALRAWAAVPGARVGVLVHDTIPLDLPGSQRPGTTAEFRARMKAVSATADLVFYVSGASQRAAETHFAGFGRVPPGRVARIGVDPVAPDPAALPPGLPPEGPYFVTLGTIEPRKDHALLLDIWEALGPSAPPLLILGRRGWNNADVFRRLDALKAAGSATVRELSGLGDPAVAALVEGATALLMPSRAEGFGLPVAEAMNLGTPVIACDLDAYHDSAGDYPVYLRAGDLYAWKETIAGLIAAPDSCRKPARAPADWAAHFNSVLGSSW